MYGAPRDSGGFATSAILNGDMSVAQLNPSGNIINPFSVALAVAGANMQRSFVDGWQFPYDVGGFAFNINYNQINDHPVLLTDGYSFSYNCQTLFAPGPAHWLSLAQYIEGNYIAQFANQACNLTFFVWSPFIGNHYATLFLSSGGTGGPGTGASIVLPYVVAAANSWQKITIPLDFTNAIFLAGIGAVPNAARAATLHFPFFIGSNAQTNIINTWIASPSNAMVGTDFQQFTNMGATVFKVTDVSIKTGSNNAYPRKTPSTALLDAQRYYFDTQIPVGAALVQRPYQYYARLAGINNDGLVIPYPVTMRATPTITPVNTVDSSTAWRNTSLGASSGICVVEQLSNKYCFLKNPQVVADVAGNNMQIGAIFDARLT